MAVPAVLASPDPTCRFEPPRPLRRSITVPCQVVRERDFRLLARWTMDLSPEGMRVRADLPVLTGELVIVSFLAPLARAWFDAEAFVTRVVHGRRPGDAGRELGIRFEHVELASRALLERELGWFRAAPSRPR